MTLIVSQTDRLSARLCFPQEHYRSGDLQRQYRSTIAGVHKHSAASDLNHVYTFRILSSQKPPRRNFPALEKNTTDMGWSLSSH